MSKGKKEDTDFTEITGTGDADKKKKGRGPGKKSKVEKFTAQEIAEKLHILFGGMAKILRYEYEYGPEDFEQESRALVRLTDKVPIVGQIIMLFDPILIVLGLVSKWGALRKKVEREGKQNAGTNIAEIRPAFSISGSDREREVLPG